MADTKESGIVRIADDVVAVIAGIAASETPGVVAMSGGITEGLARRVSGKNVHKGVHVEVGEYEAAIDLRVIVKYGMKIDEVSRNLQNNVKNAVESMTGLNVVEVNVKVEGVDLKEEASGDDDNRVK
ncbi:MAG: Asp23/Gls24 family envelope stress response protein [Bacillaceae bacterium]|nr:Asp23/Gls24 family envelope stress response protein [Bacillaceae bacterium]